MTRFGWLMTTYFSVLLFGGLAFIHPTPRLLWNATASTPIGLYAVRPARILHAGDLVAARPPEPVARLLASGGYLPIDVPLLKQVAALPGQTICRIGRLITIDGAAAGEAREHDSHGRALPVWSGCRILGKGEIFLLNRHPDSLDGRYFGPLPVSSVIGRATSLWLADHAPERQASGRFPLHP